MKLYYYASILIFSMAFYFWFYNSYLYEVAYAKYFYDNIIILPIYEPGKSEPVNNYTTDNLLDYVPFYGRLLYMLCQASMILTPVLTLITFLLGCVLFFRERKYLDCKWCLKQAFLYYLVIWFFFNAFLVMD